MRRKCVVALASLAGILAAGIFAAGTPVCAEEKEVKEETAAEKPAAPEAKPEEAKAAAPAGIQDGGFEEGEKGWEVSKAEGMLIEVVQENAGTGKSALHYKCTKDSPVGQGKWFDFVQTIAPPGELQFSFQYFLKSFNGRANASFKVEGFDSTGKKRVQADYHWGGTNWDCGNDPPEKCEGAYAINVGLASELGKWYAQTVEPKVDVDKIHGQGTWDSLSITSLKIHLYGWAFEGSTDDVMEGYVDEVRVGAPSAEEEGI